MNLSLISNIYTKPWAIYPAYVESVLPFVAGLIEGKDVKWKEAKAEKPFIVTGSAGSDRVKYKDAQPGSIAVISISGPLQKNDQYCGPVGTATIAGYIKEAAANPNIDGIILKIDSPGGTVDGTEELARVIQSTGKPVVALADGMAASAAYWIASACDEIICNGQTTMLGSIGTMMSFVDMQPYFEKAGIKFHEAYATKSVDKNKAFRTARIDGNYDQIVSEFLDPTNEVFLNTIETNRAGKLSAKENVLTGKMYHATEAKKFGLADSIGNINTAVSAVRRLTKSSKFKKSNMSNEVKDLNQVVAAAGGNPITPVAAGDIAADGGFMLSEEQLNALADTLAANAAAIAANETALVAAQNIQSEALATANSEVDRLTAELATTNATIAANADIIVGLNATIETLNGQVASLTTERDAAREQVRKFGGKTSGAGTRIIAPTDKEPGKKSGNQPDWYVPDGSEKLVDERYH